eukprot:361323-Chlamydomonas_euryale.AAC.13
MRRVRSPDSPLLFPLVSNLLRVHAVSPWYALRNVCCPLTHLTAHNRNLSLTAALEASAAAGEGGQWRRRSSECPPPPPSSLPLHLRSTYPTRPGDGRRRVGRSSSSRRVARRSRAPCRRSGACVARPVARPSPEARPDRPEAVAESAARPRPRLGPSAPHRRPGRDISASNVLIARGMHPSG